MEMDKQMVGVIISAVDKISNSNYNSMRKKLLHIVIWVEASEYKW